MSSKDEKYISLKEAAELSGYSSDYVGQLIRKGKLHGKQVYSSVVWMTTESALEGYIAEAKKGRKEQGGGQDLKEMVNRTKNSFFSQIEFAKLYRSFLYGAIALSALFSLFLFYVLSVSIDKRFERHAVEKAIGEIPQFPDDAFENTTF